MKTILSDTMIALIKSNDDTLLQNIFRQLKNMESTSNTSVSDKTSTAPAPAPVR